MTYQAPLLVTAICLIAAAFVCGFAVGLSPRGRRDAESKKKKAIEKLLRKEKSK